MKFATQRAVLESLCSGAAKVAGVKLHLQDGVLLLDGKTAHELRLAEELERDQGWVIEVKDVRIRFKDLTGDMQTLVHQIVLEVEATVNGAAVKASARLTHLNEHDGEEWGPYAAEDDGVEWQPRDNKDAEFIGKYLEQYAGRMSWVPDLLGLGAVAEDDAE